VPTHSARWFWYSTSITQKRPVPSLVRFGSEIERSTCQVFSRSPGRTGSPNTMVLSVITASGSSSTCFRSKWTCSGCADPLRPGAQWCGRNQTDSMLGGAIQPSVRAFAIFSSQNSGLPFCTEAQLVKT
jgi:hypothetical protein